MKEIRQLLWGKLTKSSGLHLTSFNSFVMCGKEKRNRDELLKTSVILAQITTAKWL